MNKKVRIIPFPQFLLFGAMKTSTFLSKLFRKNNESKIVAIVGEGHIDGMASKLSSINPKIVRLSDLLSRKSNTLSFSIKV